MTERSNKLLSKAILIEGYSMTIAVEGTTIGRTCSDSYVLTDRDVGFETGIHPILVHGIIHHHGEVVPVASIADNDKSRILTSGIAVDVGIFDVLIVQLCPRLTVGEVGDDMVGCKDAVLNAQITATGNPGHEATVAVCIFCLKTAIELTVADNHIGSTQTGYEAGEKSFAIDGTLKGY